MIDSGEHGRWLVEPSETPGQVREYFLSQYESSRSIVAAARLTDRARAGSRFEGWRPVRGLAAGSRAGGRFEDEPPALSWILFHLLQEYARHAGQLDIARELADGSLGE